MSEKKKCFIIMPIAIPKIFLHLYRNDKDHFMHVLDCLFIPAIKKSNLDPITPIAKGAELIHGRTIKHIETSDLVLCDISTLNPNVFFELGVRSALNKPVCLVKDEIIKKIPFDTTIINHHTYKNLLPTWEIQKEIDQLVKHIEESIKTSNGMNELWKYFGLSSIAHPVKEKVGVAERLAYLAAQVDSLKENFQASHYLPSPSITHEGADEPFGAEYGHFIPYSQTLTKFKETAMEILMEYAEAKGVKITDYFMGPDNLEIYVKKGTLTKETRNILTRKANAFEFSIKIIEEGLKK